MSVSLNTVEPCDFFVTFSLEKVIIYSLVNVSLEKVTRLCSPVNVSLEEVTSLVNISLEKVTRLYKPCKRFT